jgi:hypothetical protein
LGGLSCPDAILEVRVTSNSRENRLMGRSRAVTRFMVMLPRAMLPVQRSSNEGWQFGLFYPKVQIQIGANVDRVRHQGDPLESKRFNSREKFNALRKKTSAKPRYSA